MCLCVCSYLKRILDTTSRYKYIQHAYENMRKWMKAGNEEERALKRYIHRHLDIPLTLDASKREEAKDILTEFGFQYVSDLLTYCSDELKEGRCLA